MHETMNQDGEAARFSVSRRSPEKSNPAKFEVISGEIGPDFAKASTGKEVKDKPKELSKVESKTAFFSNYIDGVVAKKGGSGLSSNEARVVRKDLANMQVGGEIIKEIKAADYYDTGKEITIPTDTGDATFKLAIYRDAEQSKFKFQLEAVNDLAKKLASN